MEKWLVLTWDVKGDESLVLAWASLCRTLRRAKQIRAQREMPGFRVVSIVPSSLLAGVGDFCEPQKLKRPTRRQVMAANLDKIAVRTQTQ